MVILMSGIDYFPLISICVPIVTVFIFLIVAMILKIKIKIIPGIFVIHGLVIILFLSIAMISWFSSKTSISRIIEYLMIWLPLFFVGLLSIILGIIIHHKPKKKSNKKRT